MQSHRAWKTCQFWTFVHRWTKINSSSSYLKTRRELLLLSLSLCIKIHAVMCTVNTPHIHVWVNSLYEWLNYVSFSNALWRWQWYTYCGWSLPRRADVCLHMVEWKRIKGLICFVKSLLVMDMLYIYSQPFLSWLSDFHLLSFRIWLLLGRGRTDPPIADSFWAPVFVIRVAFKVSGYSWTTSTVTKKQPVLIHF